jgi:predicted dehydrogenase
VAENVRFSPIFRKTAELVAEGVIGRPALVQLTREAYLRQSFIEERPWFLNAHAAAGGIMMSGGVHDFEKLRMIVGEIESVHARRARQRFVEMEGDDTSIASLHFVNGAVGVMVESFLMKSLVTAAGPEVHTLRIDGDLGALWVPDEQTIRIFSERADYLVDGRGSERTISVPAADTFYLEIAHFLECIATGQEPLTSGRSQRRPLELVLAAYRSMESGLPETV